MAGKYPSSNDRSYDLIRKIVDNTATIADSPGGGVTSIVAGTGISVSSGTGDVTVSANTQAALNAISSTQGSILYRNAASWVALSPGTSGQLLQTQGAAANPQWVTATGGAGDVNGPASSTDNAIARFDATSGKIIQNSAVTIADTTGAMTWSGDATLSGGSSGASLALGSGATGNVVLTPQTSGAVQINPASTRSPILDYYRSGALKWEAYVDSSDIYTLRDGTNGVNVATLHQGTSSTASLRIVPATPATNVDTGGLRSANFGLSTVSGGASYFGGNVNAVNNTVGGDTLISATNTAASGNSSATITATSATGSISLGALASTYGLATIAGRGVLSGSKGVTIGSGFAAASGSTDTIAFQIGGYNVSPTITLSGSTQTNAVLALAGTTSASSSTVGALTIGNGSAATNVAIGGGNINAGGTITNGGLISGGTNVYAGAASASSDPLFRAYRSTGGGEWLDIVAANGGSKGNNQYSFDVVGATARPIKFRRSTDNVSFTDAFTIAANGETAITSTSPSTGVGSGALAVAGGIYAGANSRFDGKVTVGGLGTSSVAFTVATSEVAGTFQQIYNSATNKTAGLYMSNTAGDVYVTNAGTTNDTIVGSIAGALALRSPTQVILSANGGTNAHLTIASTGAATFAGAVTTSSATLSGAGAIPITTSLVKFTSTGAAQALTLANGVDGQRLTIVHDVDGGSGVLTPTTKTGFSTVTFTNAGDTVSLVYVTTRGWMVTGSYLATIAP